MKKIFKVSLFDDRIKDKRFEVGLNTNNGFVFMTDDCEKASNAFQMEIEWLNNHCTNYSINTRHGFSVNIASTCGFDENGNCKWNWERQSNGDYLF